MIALTEEELKIRDKELKELSMCIAKLYVQHHRMARLVRPKKKGRASKY